MLHHVSKAAFVCLKVQLVNNLIIILPGFQNAFINMFLLVSIGMNRHGIFLWHAIV